MRIFGLKNMLTSTHIATSILRQSKYHVFMIFPWQISIETAHFKHVPGALGWLVRLALANCQFASQLGWVSFKTHLTHPAKDATRIYNIIRLCQLN
jgi:hypothetical protein